MNSISSTNRDEQIKTLAKIISDCKESKVPSIGIINCLINNSISHDEYYYWYAEVKAAHVNNVLLEIVAVGDDSLSTSASIPANVQKVTSAIGKPISIVTTSAISCI